MASSQGLLQPRLTWVALPAAVTTEEPAGGRHSPTSTRLPQRTSRTPPLVTYDNKKNAEGGRIDHRGPLWCGHSMSRKSGTARERPGLLS